MTFVFYDTETTGLTSGFDQILQFAAIKTDSELNEIDSINVRSRLLPHIVPSPGALAATKIHPSKLLDEKYPSHYKKIRDVRAKLLEWSPATFAGYNSVDFDEEIFRQALFQTLHSPYLTNTKNNKRADVLRMAHAAAVYRPGTLKIPQDQKGKETFKLELLAPANGYDHEDAHDALADVRATIHIARLIKDRAPDIWATMLGNADKKSTIEKIAAAAQLSWSERYGAKNFSWIVTPCGSNPQNPGQIGVFDLAHNPDEFMHLGVEELIALLGAPKKVIRSIRANAQPIVFSSSEAPAFAEANEVPPGERERRAAVIATNDAFKARVGEALSLRFADQPKSIYVEERIYDGFANEDEPAMEIFHRIEWAARHEQSSSFKDDRIKAFVTRLLFFEHPSGMRDDRRAEMIEWTRERWLSEDEEVPWMTASKAMAEADKLLEKADAERASILKDTKDYLSDMQKKLKSSP
jgi:exodeoxyribonuclease-1